MAERKGSRRVPAWVIDDWTFLSVSGYGSRWEGFTAALRGCVWDEQDRQTRQTRFLWVSKQTREKKKTYERGRLELLRRFRCTAIAQGAGGYSFFSFFFFDGAGVIGPKV